MEAGLFSSWIALSIGFLHALEPGHGKTALFTYLASGKKTWTEGIIISLSSALTHSAAVFVIAFASHYLLHHAATEESIHEFAGVLSFLSGAIICFLGVWVLIKTKRGDDLHANCCAANNNKSHASAAKNNLILNSTTSNQIFSLDTNSISFKSTKSKTIKSNFLTSGLIGIATGIIPCPTVIVAYLSGVSTGNMMDGVQSVASFAVGMFLALMSVIMAFNFGGQKIIKKLKQKFNII